MPLGWIYGKIANRRNASYDSGRTAVHDLGVRTISVGNITTGGTGKTPLVILIGQILAARGKRVCILTRGYGRSNPKRRILVSNGREILANAADAGDEPVEMAISLLGKAVVIADADRVAAARWAIEEFGVTTFVLDDGFQHRRAGRDLDIVCIDATDPFAEGKMLPFGRLREPLPNLKRADVFVITRSDLGADIPEIRSQIARYAGDKPVFTATGKIINITLLEEHLAPATGSGRDVETFDFGKLAHASAFAFCGLGNPEAFFEQLRRGNYTISGTHAFPDHNKYLKKDIDFIEKKARESGAGFLLTTAKDAVKLSGLSPDLPCFVVLSETVLDDRERFAAML